MSIHGSSCQALGRPFLQLLGLGLQQTAHRSAGCRTDCSFRSPPEAFGLLRSLQNHFRYMSVQASLSKLRPPEPLLQVFPPERPVGSHAGLCGGRVPGYLTSRGYQEPGAAVRFQTWDVSSGFNNPQLYFRPPPLSYKMGARDVAAVPGTHRIHQVLAPVPISGDQQATSRSPLDI